MKRIVVITMAFVIVCGTAFAGSVSAQQPKTSHAWVAWANVGLKANAKMTFKQHTIFLYLQGGPGAPPGAATFGYVGQMNVMASELSSDALMVGATADSPSPVLNRALVHEAIDYNRLAWDYIRKTSNTVHLQDVHRCQADWYTVRRDVPSVLMASLIWQIFVAE